MGAAQRVRAVGRVEQMSQQSARAQARATTRRPPVLDAPTDKVYAAVASGAAKAAGHQYHDAGPGSGRTGPGSPMASRSPASAGQLARATTSRIMLDPLSAHRFASPMPRRWVMNSVLRVCAEMKVECSKSQQQARNARRLVVPLHLKSGSGAEPPQAKLPPILFRPKVGFHLGPSGASAAPSRLKPLLVKNSVTVQSRFPLWTGHKKSPGQ